jgi:hypothetical protein
VSARRRLALLALVLILACALTWWLRRTVPPEPSTAERGPPSAAAEQARAPARLEPLLDAGAGAQQRTDARTKRDALYQRIVRAHADRPGAPAPAPAPAAHAADAEDDARDRPGALVDRVGGREAMVGHLNRDFMPLARECIEQAQEQAPELRGMLALSVEVIADQQLGGVVERAVPAARNEVAHAALLECIAQTALSVTFPPPLVSGREQFELTLRVRPAGDAGSL